MALATRRLGSLSLVLLLVILPLFGMGAIVEAAAAWLRRGGVAVSEPAGYLVLQSIHAAWAWWLAGRIGLDPMWLVRRPRQPPSMLGVAATAATIPFAVGSMLLTVLAVLLLAPGAGAGLLEMLNAPDEPLAGRARVLAWISDQLVAPALEELVVRGILLHAIAARSSFARGVVVSTLAFSLLHADLLGAALFSLVMIALMVQTGSVVVPMAAHALHNVALELLSAVEAGPASITAAWLRESAPWLAVVAALSLLVGLAYLRSVWSRSGVRVGSGWGQGRRP